MLYICNVCYVYFRPGTAASDLDTSLCMGSPQISASLFRKTTSNAFVNIFEQQLFLKVMECLKKGT